MNMEKKEYIAPECEVVELEIVSMIAGSFTEGSGEIDKNDPNDQGANRYRGQWGNLWGSDK